MININLFLTFPWFHTRIGSTAVQFIFRPQSFTYVLVNQGEVSFKLMVSPEMAPKVHVVAYAILPSENVIAHSTSFSTETCFSHKVSLKGRHMSHRCSLYVVLQKDKYMCPVDKINKCLCVFMCVYVRCRWSFLHPQLSQDWTQPCRWQPSRTLCAAWALLIRVSSSRKEQMLWLQKR